MATRMQPFLCYLQPHIAEHQKGTNHRTKWAQPQPSHRGAALHRRLQPRYTRKHNRIPCVDMSKNHPAIKKKRNIKNCHRGTSFWHVDEHSCVAFGMSTGTGDILACRRAPHLHRFGMSTGTSTSFWHVDWHIYYVTLYDSPFPTNFLASRGVSLACQRVILACRRAHLLFYTLLFSLSNLLFGMSTGSLWHADGHNYYFTLCYSTVPTNFLASRGVILACRRGHFACRRAHLLFYALLLSLSNLLLGIAGRHFGMSTGSFWHVHGHIFYFNTILHFSPLPPYFLASWAHLLFYTLLLSCPTYFLASGASFWHVDGHKYSFCHADGHMYYFTLYYSPCPTYLFLASRGVILACRRGHFGMSKDTFTISHFTFSLSNLLFGIAGRLFGILTGTLSFLQFTILPFQTTFWHLWDLLLRFHIYATLWDVLLVLVWGWGGGVVGCDNVLWL